jgi:penicillin-binding protein 2
LLVFFMFMALMTRLWFLQVMASERYRSQASQNAVRLVEIPAPRGRILDVNGDPIVDNEPSLQVVIDRDEVQGQETQVIAALAPLLRVDVPTLTKRFESNKYLPYAPVPVAFNVPKEVVFAIAEYPDRYLGVHWQQTPSRQYLHQNDAAHILGFIGPITAEEAADPVYANYDPNDVVGQAGLEKQYESFLRGTKGHQKLRINATGKILDPTLGEPDPPVPGKDVRLNIDLDTQELVQRSLELGMRKAQGAGYKAPAGAVVVIDPDTGAVRAVASYPTFDPKIFNGGLTQPKMATLGMGDRRDYGGPLLKEWKAAQAFPPLFDRAMDGDYPPGSTIKPFVVLAALHDGLANQTRYYPCPAEYTVGGHPYKNWAWPADMGSMTLQEALVQSCDTVFYDIGYHGYWSTYYPPPDLATSRQPKEWLQRDFRAFGLGSAPGIDFPSAGSGLVPDSAWKMATYGPTFNKNPDATQPSEYDIPSELYCEWRWCPGDYINMAIGQGNMRTTPLQLAQGFGVIASEGNLCQPRLAADAEQNGRVIQRFQPECTTLSGYPPGWFRYVKDGLAGVPRNGTASGAFIGFPFASLDYFGGKTGTAQVTGKDDYSWFAGIAKGQTPSGETKQYVVVALVEQGGHGSETAAPIVRQVMDGLFDLKDNYALTIASVAD